MPLQPKLRNNVYYAVGKVEYNGRPITKYIRRSTGASTEAGARDWIRDFEEAQIRRYHFGEEAEVVTFGKAILEYHAKPTQALALMKLLDAAPELENKPIKEITGKYIKRLGLDLFPDLCTDSVFRHVVSPVRAVVNNMHELGKGPPLKVKAFTEAERIERDTKRGKLSRKPRNASDKQWIEKFRANADPYNAALVRFMFQTGCRIDQAVSVFPKDLDAVGCRVRLKAQKGHPEQWVAVSSDLMQELSNLKPKQPLNRKTGQRLPARVFGYASKSGYRKTWQTICKKADIPYLSAHEAGRHGFGTEMFVRQGLDAITVAKFGRWKTPQLVLSTYGHADTSENEIRELFDTK